VIRALEPGEELRVCATKGGLYMIRLVAVDADKEF
jgi:hypothetical protein